MNKFKNLITFLILCLSLCLSLELWAQDLVTTTTQVQDEIKDDVLVSVNGGARSYRPYTTVPSGGDGTSSSQPFVTYLAFQNNVKTSVWQHFVLGDGSASRNGPLFLGSDAPGAQSVTLPVKIDADGRRSLFVAVKDTADTSGASWVVVKVVNEVTTSSQNDIETSVAFDPNSICTTYLPSLCTDFTSVLSDRHTFSLFLFLADNGDNNNNIVLGSIIDPNDYSGKGLYWNFKLSSKLPSFPSGSISLTEVRRGDKRILLDYSIPSAITDFKEIMVVFNQSKTTSSSNEVFSSIASSLTNFSTSFDDYGKNLSGFVTLKNLKNGSDYSASIGVIDFYYLAPAFSPVGTGMPATIEELLKDQNCFFLTAGFGEDHPVIRGFRNFRDSVLLKTHAGNVFVGIYYKIGPVLAPFLYKSEVLRELVRVWSTSIFQIATYLNTYLYPFILLLLLFYLFGKLRNKLSFFQSRQ